MAIRAARYVLVGSNEDGIHADTCDTEERGDATTVDFRLDGNLSRRSHHNPDGSEWISTCEYDDRGRLTQMRTETAGGVAKLRFYEYDNAGRLLRVFARNRDGDHTVETYEYDPSGRKSKTLHVDVAAQRTDTQYAWRVGGTDSLYSVPGTASLTTIVAGQRSCCFVTWQAASWAGLSSDTTTLDG